MKLRVVFASSNEHKYEEMKRLFKGANIELLFGSEVLSKGLDVEESGKSYAENALIKARAWSEGTGMPAMSDDSGLEVEALDWRPGIFSSRVAEDDESRIRRLLEELGRREKRRARFVAALSLVFPQRAQVWITEGFCWGRIAFEPSGSFGFGYDPVFVPMGYEASFAELGPKVKSLISHRAVAACALSQLLSSGGF